MQYMADAAIGAKELAFVDSADKKQYKPCCTKKKQPSYFVLFF